MPLIYLASADDLARWQVDQLTWSLRQGHRALTVSCFDTAPMGYDIDSASQTVLELLIDFLRSHSEIESLTILCGDETAYKAYSLHFDLWCAAHRTSQDR